MENDIAFQKALAIAYRFLALRAYSCQELTTKLLQKSFAPDVTEQVLAHIQQQGYINDEDVALQWAQSLVRNRTWGRVKITQYLKRKGIAYETIDRVQRKIWREFNEEDIARRALHKHYRGHATLPSVDKRARFLKARGFSAEAIYRCLDFSSTELAEDEA
jgi:regulatory protein